MKQAFDRTTISVLLLTVLLVGLSSLAAAQSFERRVRFGRGRTTEVLKGTIRQGESHKYILGASASQTMTVHLAAPGNTSFVVYPRNGGGPLPGAENVKDWSGELSQTGDYVIELGTERRAAGYTLEVSIR